MMKSSDSVKTYLQEIRSVPLLTKKEEEIEIARGMEDCHIAIIRKLLGTGVLIEEINNLRNVLSETEEGNAGVIRDDAGILTEDEDDRSEVLKVIEEISNLFHSSRDSALLISLILDADRLTGIIEKTVERFKRDDKLGKYKLKEILSSIDEIENKLME